MDDPEREPEPASESEPPAPDQVPQVYTGLQPLMHYAYTPSPEQLARDNQTVLDQFAERQRIDQTIQRAQEETRRRRSAKEDGGGE